MSRYGWWGLLWRLLVVMAGCSALTTGVIFVGGSGDGHDPAYEQDVGVLLDAELKEALDHEAVRRAQATTKRLSQDVGVAEQVDVGADLPPSR